MPLRMTDGLKPVSIRHRNKTSAVIAFDDGSESFSKCLQCPDLPCATYNEQELVVTRLPFFPHDRNLVVCPTDAITLSDDGIHPKIERDQCIACGACIARCPVSAIYFDDDCAAVVSTNNAAWTEETDDLDLFRESRRLFHGVIRTGTSLEINHDHVGVVRERIYSQMSTMPDSFSDHFARSLFTAAGLNFTIRRRGVTAIRVDALSTVINDLLLVAEIELDESTILEAPRALLDSLAVLYNRHKFDHSTTIPVVVCLAVPSRRTDYWHVLQDIKKVLGIRVQTLSVFGLLSFVWTRTDIAPPLANGSFFADSETNSYLVEVLQAALGIDLSELSSEDGFVDFDK